MDIKKHKQAFGTHAKEYRKYRGSYDKRLYTKILSLVQEKNNNKDISIIDIGCGVGNSTEPILLEAKKKKLNLSLVGCDPDERMLAEARKAAKKYNLPITYKQAAAEKLPFKKGTFDAAFSGAAFHWFATKKALHEIERVLKPSGVYIAFWVLTVRNNKPTIGEEVYKKYKSQGIPKELRDIENIRTLFISAGFTDVGTTKIPFHEKMSIPETIGLMKTNSAYALLSETDKKGFVKELTAAYTKVLGRGGSEKRKEEICVCWGYKK